MFLRIVHIDFRYPIPQGNIFAKYSIKSGVHWCALLVKFMTVTVAV